MSVEMKLILDVGCGSRPYRKRGYETACIDTYADYTPQAEDRDMRLKLNTGIILFERQESTLPLKITCFS